MDERIINASRNVVAILDPFTPAARKIIFDEVAKVLNIK
jgi:hypothetical protein